MNPESLEIRKKLELIGLELPQAAKPGGNYHSVVERNHTAHVSTQFPIRDGNFFYQGKLGCEWSTEDGYKALQLCALNVLAQVCHHIGCYRVRGLNHLEIYYRADEGWDDAPKAADGASDLFHHVLGERGVHTRAIMGVAHLPRRFAVGLVSSFALTDG